MRNAAPVTSLGEETRVAGRVGTFATHGSNHIPVTDAGGRLSGIIIRLDLLNLFGDPLRTSKAA